MTDLYRPLRDDYAWHVPRFINLADRCCLQWASVPTHAKTLAIETLGPDGHAQSISFQALAALTGKLANGLDRMGARPGDRISIIMRDRVEAIAVMMACWARQCIAVTLSTSEHGDIMTQRVRQSRCRIVFTDDSEPDKVLSSLQRCNRVQQIVGLDVRADNVMSWKGLLARQPDTLTIEPTRAQQPALLTWPHRPTTIYPPQTAYLMAHQALIGNLPGFVASNNWFPSEASGMLTTSSMMSEAGLFGVILPSLYFGVGVRLQSALPRNPQALSQGGLTISHVNTSAGMLCQWLLRTPDVSGFSLKGVSVFGELLTTHWREATHIRFGIAPNLCTFIEGCGLVWGDSHQKWPSNPTRAGRIYPGHQVLQQRTVDPQSPQDPDLPKLYVSRTDPIGDVDPALYVGVWPLKEPADMVDPIHIKPEHPCNVLGEIHDDGSVSVTGWHEDALLIGNKAVHPLTLEQAAMSVPQVMLAAAIQPISQKTAPDDAEVWLIVELDSATNISYALNTGLGNRILNSLAGLVDPNRLKVGIAQRISIDTSGYPRRDMLRLRHGLSGVQPLDISSSQQI